MRFILFFIISLSWLLSEPASAQDSVKSSQNFMRDLPEVTLKSQFRILVAEFNSIHLDEMKGLAEEFTQKTRQNAYFIQNGKLIQLQTGDYSSKEFAKPRLAWLKENFKKCSLVKANNDSIIMMAEYSGRKCLFKTPYDELARQEALKEINIALKDSVVDFSVWNKPKYLAANTARDEDYLTYEEKKVFYYLNLMRMNPGLFAATYLHALKGSKNYYESTLLRDLKRLSPKPILVPDLKLFESAKCHAVESGRTGYVGHNRKKCAEYFVGECCHYGDAEALDIVIYLLIDKGVESLGHRQICMMDFNRLGVSIQPHKSFNVNAVLDFGYDPDENRLPTKKQ